MDPVCGVEGQTPAGSRVRKEWVVKKETWSVDKKLCPRREDRNWSWLQILGRGCCFSRDEAEAASKAREGRKVERGPVVGGVGGPGGKQPGAGQGQEVCGDMGMAGSTVGSHFSPQAQVVSLGETQGARRL